MDLVPVFISALALLFTFVTFWYLNVRRGRLQVTPPRIFAAHAQAGGKMIMQIPLVFYNNGPVPIIVQSLRLILVDEPNSAPLKYIATISKVGGSEGRTYGAQFVVAGRQALTMICEFQREPNSSTFNAQVYTFDLEAFFFPQNKWTRVVRFELNFPSETIADLRNQLLPFDTVRLPQRGRHQ